MATIAPVRTRRRVPTMNRAEHSISIEIAPAAA
jgi:hypothetical protein